MWVLQDKDYGLGNFTNLTPTIYWLSVTRGKKVDVYFESDYVKEVFKNSRYISVLNKRPDSDPLFSSSLINQEIPDSQFVFNEVIGGGWMSPKTFAPKRKTVCIMNGCANDAKRAFKNPGAEAYNDIISMIPPEYDIFFVGSQRDLHYSNKINAHEFIIDKIPLIQHLISTCDFVVSNDTGWYHVAGAYQKKGFIMWKHTKFMKNKSPNGNFFYSFNGNWVTDFKKWVNDCI